MNNKKLGIIVEYNPFHNGHLYQLEYAKSNFPEHKIYLFMTGKFTQRGEYNVLSFKYRQQIAKKYGVHKVIKLNQNYTTQAAHIFAEHGILMMKKYHIDDILFGSETNDIQIFKRIADVIINEPQKYNSLLKAFLKKGLSFPKANNEALIKLFGENIQMPNDILGLEYVKAIYKHKLNLEPHCHLRTNDFHSDTPKGKYASATYIRYLMNQNNYNEAEKYTPITLPMNFNKIQHKFNKFQRILRRLSTKDLKQINLISEGMENLFKKHMNCKSYEEFINACNSKRYTSSRIKRVILAVLLKKFPLKYIVKKPWILFY